MLTNWQIVVEYLIKHNWGPRNEGTSWFIHFLCLLSYLFRTPVFHHGASPMLITQPCNIVFPSIARLGSRNHRHKPVTNIYIMEQHPVTEFPIISGETCIRTIIIRNVDLSNNTK